MSQDIPTREPRSFIAGETLEWSKSFDDYPADEWTLKYSLRGPGTAPADITATADGEDFLVDVSSTYTAALTPGTWRMVGWVEKGSEKHFVYDREVIVVAAPATSGTLDARSTAKQIVDAIDAYMLAGPAASNAVKRYRIADRELERYDAAQLKDLRTYYWNIYVREERSKRGGSSMRNINCGF
jgi:hypothetical protein